MNPHKIAFVLASTAHGLMIVNRLDQFTRPLTEAEGGGYLTFGVGVELMETAQYSGDEIGAGMRLLDVMKRHRSLPLQVYDVGANIGTHTIAWADHVRGWGEVHAYEAQRMVYYALCGNVVLNNLPNVRTVNAVVGNYWGGIHVPKLDYFSPASFGSIEVKPSSHQEIGQDVNLDDAEPCSLQKLEVRRIDFLKIDVEGMELEVLQGAEVPIKEYRPIIMLEWLKCDQQALADWLQGHGYKLTALGRHNWVAIHADDPVLTELREREGVAT